MHVRIRIRIEIGTKNCLLSIRKYQFRDDCCGKKTLGKIDFIEGETHTHTHTSNHQLQYGDVLHCDFHRAKLLFCIPLFITVCYIDFSFSILAFDMNLYVDCSDIPFKCNRII